MITHSLIIPVFKNAQNIDSLLQNLSAFFQKTQYKAEVIFVVDGNPEGEFQLLQRKLKNVPFDSQLILHSRNFGSQGAIRTGLEYVRGQYIAVMAADGQEPWSLIQDFFETLAAGKYELVVATREKRDDPFLTKLSSSLFWKLYRALINPAIPDGGVDVFACSRGFRDQLLKLSEVNTSLIGQLYWLGFERKTLHYVREKRKYGKSAWTFSKKMKYMTDSVFSFTDFPLRILLLLGILGVCTSIVLAIITFMARIFGKIAVPGYTSTFLIVSFFGSINLVSLGIVGLYIYRTYENTKGRPVTLVADVKRFRSYQKTT